MKPLLNRLLPLCLAAFLLAGCSGGESQPAPAPEPAPTAEPTPAPPKSVTLAGNRYDINIEKLLPPNPQVFTKKDFTALRRALPYMKNLKTADLSGCSLWDELYALGEDYPALELVYTVEAAGKTVSTTETRLDLSGTPVEDVPALEDALRHLRKLEWVDMSFCGVPDREMDELNRRHEDIRFVWTVHLMWYAVRTDATAFTLYNCKGWPGDTWAQDFTVLNYCTDMIALDLGHNNFVKDCEYVRYMPHLKYLVLAETEVRDLTPVGTCRELVWLECFLGLMSDLRPLKTCTALEDLNFCYSWNIPGDSAFETLMELPSLKRAWACGNRMTEEQIHELMSARPDCEWQLYAGPGSTFGTWRYNDNYCAMRDALGMFYADAKGDPR